MTVSSAASRVGRILREALLTLAALGGVICIVMTVLAYTGGFSLIMFKTGSMSPTIPAGSVALVQEIPASEIAVGDVVTVDRPAGLPVTHRVTSVATGSTTNERLITMRGDANETEDPAPYAVADVRIVRGSVPQLAHVIVWFGNPLVLGALSVGAAVLVTWAFWPRESRRRRDEVAPDSTDGENDSSATPPRTRRELRGARALGVAIVLGSATLSVGIWTPAPAQASDMLKMSSDLSGTQILSPVDPLYWHVDVDAGAAPEDGMLTITLAGASRTADVEIVAEVWSCAAVWVSNNCSQGEVLLREKARLDLNGPWEQLVESTTPGTVYLRIGLTAPVTNASHQTASLTVRAAAAGETAEEDVSGEPELPETGGASWAMFAAPGAVLVGIGTALIARAGRRETT
ncbi:signal peptidase I [Microbacterium sp. A588]